VTRTQVSPIVVPVVKQSPEQALTLAEDPINHGGLIAVRVADALLPP